MSDNQTTEAAPEVASQEPVASPAVTNQAPEAPAVETAAPDNILGMISEDLQGMGNLKDFKDVNQLAKSYVELQRMVGNSVRIPAEDASTEARQDFLDKIKDVDGVLLKEDENLYNKLGRPEDPDAYQLEDLINPDLYTVAPELSNEVDEYKKIAHELGLNKNQASELLKMRLQGLDAVKETHIQQKEQAAQQLKQMWGDDYDNRLNAARQVMDIYSEKYGDSVQELIDSPAGNNPAFLNMLNEIAMSYKEKNHEGMGTTQFGATPDSALQKIAEKRADRGFLKAYHDDRDPGHAKAVAEMTRLYDIANRS